MAQPTLIIHVLETPSPMNAYEFANWESINRPPGRLAMSCFHPEGTDIAPYYPGKGADESLSPGAAERFARWVCVYEEHDPVTWGLIND